MASPVVQATVDQMAATDTVLGSATVFINNTAQMIQDAVAAAIANGATAAQLQPLTDAAAAMKAETDALTAALISNTPVTEAQARAKGKPAKPTP